MMLRVLIPLASFVSLFVFPWPVSLFGIFATSLIVPPLGLALGIVADFLYFVPGATVVPYFSLFGLLSFVMALLVHRFVKTRIIGE